MMYLLVMSLTIATTMGSAPEDILDYAQQLCPFLSFCTKPSLRNFSGSGPIGSGPVCTQCSCEATCFRQRKCCPDFSFPPPEDLHQTECISQVLHSPKDFQGVVSRLNGYHVVTSCPRRATTDDAVRARCENVEFNLQKLTHYGDAVFVSDERDHNMIYKNRFCALCHGVTSVVSWTLLSVDLYENYNTNVWYELQLPGPSFVKYQRDKKVVFSEPLGLQVNVSSQCLPATLGTCDTDIDGGTINDTNTWLEEACLSYHYPAIYVYSDQRLSDYEIYQNVFCFICSNPNKTLAMFGDQIILDIITSEQKLVDYTHSILDLDFSLVERKSPSRCQSSKIYDNILGKCRAMFCELNTAPSYGQCKKPVMTFAEEEIQFTLLILLNLTSPLTTDTYPKWHAIVRRNKASFIRLFNHITNMTGIDKCDLRVPKVLLSKNENIIDHFVLTFDLHPNEVCGINDLPLLLKAYVRPFHVKLPLDNDTISFVSALQTHSTEIDILQYNAIPLVFAPMRKQSLPIFLPDLFFCTHIRISRLEYAEYVKRIPQQFQNTSKNDLLPNFYHVKPLVFSPETIAVCMSSYFVVGSYQLDGQDNHDKGVNMVPVVLTACSMTSIVVLLIIMASKKSKLTTPRLIYVLTACNLLLSQGFHQFGAGQTELGHTWCFIIGVIIHYFWLSTMLSMAAYCFVLMRDLSRMRYLSEISRSNKTFIFAIALIYFIPLLFVAANIILSLKIWSTSGYANFTYCFIDHVNLRWFLFALPILVIMILNVIFFSVCVYKLQTTASYLQTQNIDRSFMRVYVRLSTLTGITWCLGFLYEFTGNIIVKYLFEIFNASQGVSMLIAFSHAGIYKALTKIRSRPSQTSSKQVRT